MGERFSQAPNVEVAPMHGETVLFNPETNKFCLLNSTAEMVWSLLERPISAEEIVRAICDKFKEVEIDRVAADVREVIGRMQGANFVVLTSGS